MKGDEEEAKEEVDDGDKEETQTDENDDMEKRDADKEEVEVPKNDDDGQSGDSTLEDEDVDQEGEEKRVTNSTLEILRLGGNGLGDDFVESMLNIFVRPGTNCNNDPMSQLQELNLFGNRLTNRGLRLILKKSKYLPNLRLLHMQHNMALRPLDMKDEILEFSLMNYTFHELSIYNPLMAITAGMQLNPSIQVLQATLDYYGRLNRTGRRIMGSFAGTDSKSGMSYENSSESQTQSNGLKNTSSTDKSSTMRESDSVHTKNKVPLGLWPLIFERANQDETVSHAADVICCLLKQGPVLFDNPNL